MPALHHSASPAAREQPEMPALLKQLGRADGGASAIEYALVALMISIAAFSVLATVGSSVGNLFRSIANGF
jgi:Flp pilus assembly pilin Flp